MGVVSFLVSTQVFDEFELGSHRQWRRGTLYIQRTHLKGKTRRAIIVGAGDLGRRLGLGPKSIKLPWPTLPVCTKLAK